MSTTTVALQAMVAQLIETQFFDEPTCEEVNLKLQVPCEQCPELYAFLLTVNTYAEDLCPLEVLVGTAFVQRGGHLTADQGGLLGRPKAERHELILDILKLASQVKSVLANGAAH